MNMTTAGNWYSIWNLSGSIEKDVNGQTTQIPYSEIIITDDDKTRSFRLECASKEEADALMRSIAYDLRMAKMPLWEVLAVPKESIPQRLMEYELKRLNYLKIAY